MDLASRLVEHVLKVQDFPRPGVVYRDITPILSDAALFREVVDTLADRFRDDGIEAVCGIEARGFLFAAPLAYRLQTGLVPVRWPGKLPRNPVSAVFELEYGFNALEAHRDLLAGGRRVLLVDDFLGTGATMAACADLVRQAGAEIVSAAVVVEAPALEGRKRLKGLPVVTLSTIPEPE